MRFERRISLQVFQRKTGLPFLKSQRAGLVSECFTYEGFCEKAEYFVSPKMCLAFNVLEETFESVINVGPKAAWTANPLTSADVVYARILSCIGRVERVDGRAAGD